MASRIWLGLGAMGLVASACGGTAVIDPPDDDGAGGATPPVDDDGTGAGGSPAGTPSGVGGAGGGPVTYDGVAQRDMGVRLRIASFDLSCPAIEAPPPFDLCGWYDVDIFLFVEDFIEGYVVTPESGMGTSSFSVAEGGPGPDCAASGGGGGLFGSVTIVDVLEDRIVVELGPDWALVSSDPALSPAGQHTLAICD